MGPRHRFRSAPAGVATRLVAEQSTPARTERADVEEPGGRAAPSARRRMRTVTPGSGRRVAAVPVIVRPSPRPRGDLTRCVTRIVSCRRWWSSDRVIHSPTGDHHRIRCAPLAWDPDGCDRRRGIVIWTWRPRRSTSTWTSSRGGHLDWGGVEPYGVVFPLRSTSGRHVLKSMSRYSSVYFTAFFAVNACPSSFQWICAAEM